MQKSGKLVILILFSCEDSNLEKTEVDTSTNGSWSYSAQAIATYENSKTFSGSILSKLMTAKDPLFHSRILQTSLLGPRMFRVIRRYFRPIL